MIDVKINITNKIANAIGTPFIVCGNSDYTVTFTFDAEWGAYQEKTARFFFVADGIEQYIDVLFSGNTCNAPVLPNIEKVLIGVYTGNLRTTTGAEVRCKRSILFGGKVHEPPTTEDVYNEILEICGKKLGTEGGTVTGDYFKDGNTFIHEGNLDLLDETDNLAITKTATGSAITIESASAPLQNLKLFGKTTQNGTPTPSAPVPFVNVGDSGSCTVKIQGGETEQTLTISCTLRGFEGVADEKNFALGKTIQRFYSRTFNGNENWELRTSGIVALVLNDFPANASSGLYSKGRILSNIAETVAWSELQNTDNGVAIGSVSSKFIGFRVAGHTESIDAWKSYLASHNVSVVYELATPIESDISETELNAYRQLYTNKGITTVLSECEETEITYYVNKPNAQAIGSLHEQINKDYFKLQQAIISTGGN